MPGDVVSKRNPDLLRVGDKIEVISPHVVARVGYPKCHADFLPEVQQTHKAAVEALFKTERMRKRAYSALAYEALGKAKFGGIERAVHTVENPEIVGHTATIRHARTVVTGKYYPPSYSYSYEGEYDSDSGGLDKREYVRLVTILFQWNEIELPASSCKRVMS